MKRKRFNPEQIAAILYQVQLGVPVKDVCRKHSICEQTFYRWKSHYFFVEGISNTGGQNKFLDNSGSYSVISNQSKQYDDSVFSPGR